MKGMTMHRTLMAMAAGISLGCVFLTSPAPCAAPAPAAGKSQLAPIVVGQPVRLEVFPASVKLSSIRSRIHLVVTGHYADGAVQDLTRVAQFASANDKIAKVAGGIAAPVSDGRTEIFVSAGGQQAKATVEVANFTKPDPVSFNHGTLVALSKQGCNSGACHGSPSGKGGFRLSLRAYDPVLDELTLIREVYNRRTNVAEPEKSLLLRKPLMEVAHGGGRRLKKGEPSYELLRQWIAEGLNLDPPSAPKCVKVDVYPRERIIKHPAHTQQLCVLAHFSDGTIRDITDIAVYSSSDEAVASVTETGLVVASDRGESAVLVRYLEKMETAHLMFLKDVPGFAWNNPKEANYVDTQVFKKLRQMQILPSELCDDDEFVRRVYLDVLGMLPTVEESRKFLAEKTPDKRANLIDQLLERPEYVDYWTLKWGDLLRVNNKKVTVPGVHKLRHWIHEAVRTNKPYNQFVAEMLSSRGSTLHNPPANYFRTAADTNDCAETTAQVFLGIRIQCAKCHNHPFERWTQDNYYGIAAFFNRIQRAAGLDPNEMLISVARGGEVVQPRTGQTMKPWLPLTGDVDLPADADRRDAFVNWIARQDNPLFPQAAVNRIWGHLIGRGIVEPVDDFRASNPPSNDGLLAALAKDFVERNFDQKHIIRTILNSRTYQLSSRKNDFNKDDDKYFSHARTRLLSAEQLLDAICTVTDLPEKFPGLPAGTRATQLPSPDVNHQFLKVFGQPAREMACQCERSSESNLSQALQMINGPLVHGKLRDANNRFRKLAAGGKKDEEIIEELYLAAFARKPSQAEVEKLVTHIKSQKNRLEALEDVCWTLLNAKEFLFQH
jgi:hypothetical protein